MKRLKDNLHFLEIFSCYVRIFVYLCKTEQQQKAYMKKLFLTTLTHF